MNYVKKFRLSSQIRFHSLQMFFVLSFIIQVLYGTMSFMCALGSAVRCKVSIQFDQYLRIGLQCSVRARDAAAVNIALRSIEMLSLRTMFY